MRSAAITTVTPAPHVPSPRRTLIPTACFAACWSGSVPGREVPSVDRTDSMSIRSEDVRAALEAELGHIFGAPRRVVALRCAPSVYSSSFSLVEVDADLDDGTSLTLLLKD